MVLVKNEAGHQAISTTQLYLTHYEGNPTKNQIPEVMMNLLDEGADL